jgi:hypothetical protein
MARGARGCRIGRDPQWNLRDPRLCFGARDVALFGGVGTYADEFSRRCYPGKIFDLAGYREKAGEGWDFYFTSGGWREACAGLDPRTIAKALAERELLEPEDTRHTAKRVSVPGCGRQRLYHIKASILEAGQ